MESRIKWLEWSEMEVRVEWDEDEWSRVGWVGGAVRQVLVGVVGRSVGRWSEGVGRRQEERDG